MSVTGMPRKSLIRRLNRPKHKRKRMKLCGKIPPRGRPRKYTTESIAALAFVWESYNYPSAERLIGSIAEAVRIFKRDKMWHFSPTDTGLLLSMSLGAMKLYCVSMAHKRGLMRGTGTTTPSNIKLAIPVFSGDWSKKGLGYGQIDTVVHSGEKLMGTMVYTVNYVDAATYWQEPIAQLEKSERATLVSMRLLEERLPFELKGLHSDTGSEFINWTAKAWCEREGIELSRSRPNKKNDNCFVEQRNNVVVRKYLGYERFDCQEAVDIMNELYGSLRLYLNFFQTTYKLIGKVPRIDSRGQKLKGHKRIYDQPATPLRRLLALPEVPEATKQKLAKQYEGLNPRVLLGKINALTNKLRKVQRKLGYHF